MANCLSLGLKQQLMTKSLPTMKEAKTSQKTQQVYFDLFSDLSSLSQMANCLSLGLKQQLMTKSLPTMKQAETS